MGIPTTIRIENHRAASAWITLGAALFLFLGYRAWNLEGSDAIAYYIAGERVLHGLTPYFLTDPTPFKYLPPISLLFALIAWLPFFWAKMAIFVTSFACMALLYIGVLRRYGQFVALAVLAACLRFHNYDFLNLQINHWILLSLALWWTWRETRLGLATFFLALAILFKVTPIVLLLGLAALGAWKELAKTMAWLLGLTILPALLSPSGFTLYAQWADLLHKTTPWPAPSDPILQSIPAAFWFLSGKLWPALQQRPQLFSGLMHALQLGFLAVSLRPAFKRGFDRKQNADLLMSALLILGPLFSPLPWKHAYLLCWPGFVSLIRRGGLADAMPPFVLMTALPAFLKFFDGGWWDYSYVTVWGAVLLWASLLRKIK